MHAKFQFDAYLVLVDSQYESAIPNIFKLRQSVKFYAREPEKTKWFEKTVDTT